MAMQKEHYVADLLLLLPCDLYHPDPLVANPFDLLKPRDVGLYDVEGRRPEFLHEPPCHDRSYAFDKP
jgi:hypothetical protein